MTKVTNKQVSTFRQNARNYLIANPEQSKLQYALSKMLKKTESIQEKYQEEEQEIRIDLATIDKDGVLVIDEKTNSYRYKKEDAKKLDQKLRELANKEVEIEPYIASHLPENLEAIWFEFFVPFVIEDKEPE